MATEHYQVKKFMLDNESVQICTEDSPHTPLEDWLNAQRNDGYVLHSILAMPHSAGKNYLVVMQRP